VSDGYDSLSAALADLELLIGDLHGLSGQLQELATVSRRMNLPGASRLEPGAQGSIRDANGRLIATLQALIDAGSGQIRGLVFSAVAQMSALDAAVRAAIATANGSQRTDATADAGSPVTGIAGMLNNTLDRVGDRLWRLISHLVQIREWPLSGQHSPGAPGPARASVTAASD
jgi:hypothetical protein